MIPNMSPTESRIWTAAIQLVFGTALLAVLRSCVRIYHAHKRARVYRDRVYRD